MRVATLTTFAASKKETLAEMAGRVRQAFLDAGLGEPTIRFTLADSALRKGVPVDRALKRHPEMERFITFSTIIPGDTTESRFLTNSATGEAVEYSTLEAILGGVPRSYTFNAVWLHFHAPVFGERLIGLPKYGGSLPGIVITDNRWINGRQRAFSAYTVVDAEAGDKKLPPNPEAVDAVMKACGKARRIEQVPIRVPGGAPGEIVGAVPRENMEAVKAIETDYRGRINEIVQMADMPHNLPPAAEVRMQNVGVTAGPRKPALEDAFKPMGYSCKGGSGTFELTKRTAGNLNIELYLDVGTWSHSVSAIFFARGGGFKASLVIPVTPLARAGQYPIGDAVQWQKIVENLAAMVRELERSFVPAIEQAAGPTPAWYRTS
jgi:hypothetical protein